MKEKKSLVEMIKGILRLNREENSTIEQIPDESTVEKLIGKAGGEKVSTVSEPAKGCPYATKRAIVTSLQEIKAFAVKHNLGDVMIKALLVLLAEMAIGAMKGKVSGRILEHLLKAVSYEQAVDAAYGEGEKAGRNATIRREYFQEEPAEVLPRLQGTSVRKPEDEDSFFTLAKGAK